jgi:adenosylhomocysteine nucleosidase
MESGAVAEAAVEAGVPFAVLRAICDPADRAVPHAALVALNAAGGLAAIRMAVSILTRPHQIAGMLALAGDAAMARRALRAHAVRMAPARRPNVGISTESILNDELVADGNL